MNDVLIVQGSLDGRQYLRFLCQATSDVYYARKIVAIRKDLVKRIFLDGCDRK